MSNIIARLTVKTVTQSFPSGTVAGSWIYTITSVEKPVVNDKVETNDPYADFNVVAGNTYVGTAQRVDADSLPLGESVGITFTVEGGEEPVLIETAGALSVSFLEKAPK